MSFLHARNPAWVGSQFFSSFDENACWLSDLKPAFNQEKFFGEDEYSNFLYLRMEILDESGQL
jgi:hypothetical protein